MGKIFSILLIIVFFLIPHQTIRARENEAVMSSKLANVVVEKDVDNRAKILKKFLQFYNSPLADNAETFVKQADANNLDWRLVASISGVESTFGKQIPYNSYNAWGWGIYGNNMIYFTSFDEAIETISKALRENYIDKWGAQNVYQIGRFYAASPTWTQRVVYFMNKVDEFAVKNPTESLSISL